MTSAAVPRPPGRPRTQSRERITAAALDFLDRHGLAALSMERFAKELGVGTMTLYGYFRNKRELLDAVVDAAAAEYPLPALEGSWKDRLRQLMRGLYDELLRHPAVIRVRFTRPIVTREGVERMEAGMRVLEQAGFPRAEAAHAFRSLFLYTFAVATFNSGGPGSSPLGPIGAALAALPADRYPILSGAVEEIGATLTGERQFVHGIDALLDGLEAKLAQ